MIEDFGGVACDGLEFGPEDKKARVLVCDSFFLFSFPSLRRLHHGYPHISHTLARPMYSMAARWDSSFLVGNIVESEFHLFLPLAWAKNFDSRDLSALVFLGT